MNQRIGWWQRARGTYIGFMVIAVLMLCSLSACAIAGGKQAVSSSNTSNPSGMPSRPTIPQDAATLGGSVVAFHVKLSAKADLFQNGWTYQGPYGEMWTGVVTGDMEAEAAGGMGSSFDVMSTQRVQTIDNVGEFLGTTWTISQAQAICRSFLPSDAQDMGTTNEYDVSQTSVIGLVQHYVSASLANTLPVSAFKDEQGKQLTPGTFYIYYEFTPETIRDGSTNPLVDWCTLSTDENHKNPY